MTSIRDLETRIHRIEERNLRVETDKSWETSLFRKMLIIISTYIVISIFMYFTDVRYPLLNAIVPTIGFFLSTLTLPFFKKYWIHHRYHQ